MSQEKPKDATIEDMMTIALKMVAEKIKESCFLKEYQHKITDQEALGVALAKYFKWDGRKIAETTFSAFEDSNFHTFNGKFNDLWKSSNKGQEDLY